MKIRIILFCLLLFISVFCLVGDDVKVIKNPKPTHFEKDHLYGKLKKVAEINTELSEDIFLVKPDSITMAENNHLYVFDSMLTEIFIFNKDLKFIKTFGEKGQGPGEFWSHARLSNIAMRVGENQKLYVQDGASARITVFDLNGTYLSDFKTKHRRQLFGPYVDKKGHYYFPSISSDGLIDVFDSQRKPLYTLLKRKDLKVFLFKKPGPIAMHSYKRIDSRHVSCDFSKKGLFYAYIKDSSTLFEIKGKTITRKLTLWPDKILKRFKAKLDEIEGKDRASSYIIFSFNFFIDKDNENYFYIDFLQDWPNKITNLYKFDFDGKLIKVLICDSTKLDNMLPRFILKKNGHIYAKTRDRVIKFKEE